MELAYNGGDTRCYQHRAPLTPTLCKESVVATRQCRSCGQEKPHSDFCICNGKAHQPCKICFNAEQRVYRAQSGNAVTKRYEKTRRGFLMRLYRNMQSRITGVQKEKFHLYAGKPLTVTRDQFYEWAFTSGEFHALFDAWEVSGYARQYTPSVDRVDSSRGYELDNMEWVTHSENSRRGSLSHHRKRAA